jgi:feruloyl-CoA synthase
MNAEQGLHLRPVRMGSLRVEADTRANGAIYLRSLETLGPYPRSMTDRLAHWAAKTPDAVFIADRGEDGEWRTLSYGDANGMIQPLAQALLDAKL